MLLSCTLYIYGLYSTVQSYQLLIHLVTILRSAATLFPFPIGKYKGQNFIHSTLYENGKNFSLDVTSLIQMSMSARVLRFPKTIGTLYQKMIVIENGRILFYKTIGVQLFSFPKSYIQTKIWFGKGQSIVYSLLAGIYYISSWKFLVENCVYSKFLKNTLGVSIVQSTKLQLLLQGLKLSRRSF